LPSTGSWTLTRTPDGTTTTGSGTSTIVSGLPANATYTFTVTNTSGCVSAVSGNVVVNGQPASPSATTIAATNIGANTATLNGTVNANGYSATVTFEYGTTTSYGSTITATQSPVTGSSNTAVSAGVTGLTPNTFYHYRVKSVNCGGAITGTDQTFSTFLCDNTLTVTHNAGNVAPVTKTVTYGIVQTNLSGENKCWITKNLGADNQAGSATDATEAAAGWYWQFNRKQGYKHDGTTRTPGTTWITAIDDEISNWTTANDPCTILLGTGWRIPTKTEWTNANNNGGWSNYNDTYASVLKLHAAGHCSDGSLNYRGSRGIFWSSTQDTNTYYGWDLYLDNSYSYIYNRDNKSAGFSLRCLRD
jgi:hypothetical protein